MAQYLASITLANGQVVGVVFQPIGNADVLAALGFTPLPSTTVLVSSWNGRTGAVTLQSGDVTTALGGTGLDSSAWAQGDLVYISAVGTWNHLAKNTAATRYLANTGASNNPAWDQVNLDNGVTGKAAVPNGGTGLATCVKGDLLYGSAADTIARLAIGSTGDVLTVAAGVPAWAAKGIAIGDAVTGASTGDVLYVKAGPVLARSNNLNFDGTILVVSAAVAGVVYICQLGQSSGVTAQFQANDGVGGNYLVALADYPNAAAVNATSGFVVTLGTTANTFKWGASHAAPGSTQVATAATVYGAGTINNLLGEPDSWALVNLGGTDYLLPAYLP